MDVGKLLQKIVRTSSIAASIGVAGVASSEPATTHIPDFPSVTPAISPESVQRVRIENARSNFTQPTITPKGIIIQGVPAVGRKFIPMVLPYDLRVVILGSQQIRFALNHDLCVAKNSGDNVIIPKGTKVLINNNALQLVESSPEMKSKYSSVTQGVLVLSNQIYAPGSTTNRRVHEFPGEAQTGMLFAISESQAQKVMDTREDLKRFIASDLSPAHPFSQGKLIKTKAI